MFITVTASDRTEIEVTAINVESITFFQSIIEEDETGLDEHDPKAIIWFNNGMKLFVTETYCEVRDLIKEASCTAFPEDRRPTEWLSCPNDKCAWAGGYDEGVARETKVTGNPIWACPECDFIIEGRRV